MANVPKFDVRPRVAIVHYWALARTGGERVVEAIAELFPQADLFMLLANRDRLAPVLSDRRLTTSFLQRIPFVERFHRHTLVLQPLALEQFDLSGYDLVISSESGPAKGVITSPKAVHVCYCHSPMRYIWDMYPQYVERMSWPTRAIFSPVAHYLRMWDYASAERVDDFVANSRFVATRVKKFYGRRSTVIHPPVDVERAKLSRTTDDYYLAGGRLVDYKRIDLAVEACSRLGRHLRVFGSGPEYRKLKKLAGPTVEFLGQLSDGELHEQYARCQALLFPGEEDFGIIPVEAQACGRPVVAYGSGGTLETVRGLDRSGASATGVFFHEQSCGALGEAILKFESHREAFVPTRIRAHALQFDRAVFQQRFMEHVSRVLEARDDLPDRRWVTAASGT